VTRSKPGITLGRRLDTLRHLKGRRICERQCETGSRKKNRTSRLFSPATVYHDVTLESSQSQWRCARAQVDREDCLV
jgi:hypothetical protein